MPDDETTTADEEELVETEIVESASVDFVNLLPAEESAAEEGMIPVRIIKPGWGTSGHYSPDSLRQAVEGGAFDNAHMHWDHISQGERPERSALKWAATILEGSTKYQETGPDGPGVYGKAFVFPHWREAVESMKSHIGLSVIGKGKTKYGSIEGRSGPLFQSLIVRDVDFVTRAGAGGKIAKQFQGFKESKPDTSTDTDAEESESDMPDKDKETSESTPAVETVVQEALKKSDAKWEARFKTLEESQRKGGFLAQARGVVSGSGLPKVAADRVMATLETDIRLAEESADPSKIAREAVEAELKYIESFTPVHLRRPNIEESMDDDKFEKSINEAMSGIYGDEPNDDDE